MRQLSLSDCLSLSIQCAEEAGNLILKANDQAKIAQMKSSSSDFATATDKACEELIVTKIKNSYPEHHIIGEESTALGTEITLTDSPTWIIDPIDGTTNFVHGFPFVAVCIGFSVKREIKVGVVYNPILKHLYFAKEGSGAYLNSTRLQASSCTDLSRSLLVSEWSYDRRRDHLACAQANFTNFLMHPCHGIRSTGSSALDLCLVAEGSVDGSWIFGLNIWDYAAASIIVKEANGVVMDVTGGPVDFLAKRVVAAGTRELALALCEKLVETPV
ncbi:inositol monophosphatase 1-like [Zophobas morio]|uniref:inositol monophosphatase 1-like n=1 Tax=Zophobas morio TaxID=2755281 RepID=UPI00308306F1